MKDLLFIKGDNIQNVRLRKYIKYFSEKRQNVHFWGWNRNSYVEKMEYCNVQYLLKGGGFGSKILLLLYPVWMILLFFKVLFFRNLDRYNLIVINFDSALPVFLASYIRKINYIYEVHDEFAISYNFPLFVKKVIKRIDDRIMNCSDLVIHVDFNRINNESCKSIVIENSPFDYYENKEINYRKDKMRFAVIGNISSVRGINSIFNFAELNDFIEILLVGKFYDQTLREKLLKLPNVIYKDYMEQDKLFEILQSCCGIFSLYDPSLEINRLAASNKVYDAMMMGIPVITNPEVVNSEFIVKNNIGLLVSYHYDETWNVLTSNDSLCVFEKIGYRGRKLYLSKFRFDYLIEHNLFKYLK